MKQQTNKVKEQKKPFVKDTQDFFPFFCACFFHSQQTFGVVWPMEEMERIYGPFLCFCQGQVLCERESFSRNTLIEAKRRRIENLSALQTTSRLILQFAYKCSIMILLNDLFVLFQPIVLLCHKFSILSPPAPFVQPLKKLSFSCFIPAQLLHSSGCVSMSRFLPFSFSYLFVEFFCVLRCPKKCGSNPKIKWNHLRNFPGGFSPSVCSAVNNNSVWFIGIWYSAGASLSWS